MAVARTGRAEVLALTACMWLAGESGCATQGDLDAVARQTAQVKADLNAMDERYAKASADMDRLRQVVDEANALLARNSADLGARVEQQGQDIATLKGKLEELLFQLAQLERRMSEDGERLSGRLDALETGQQKIADKVAPAMADSADGLWAQAQELLREGRRADARRFLDGFIKRFPTEPRAPAARLLIGKTFAEENNHRQAAGNYQKLLDEYARSAEVPEAMYQLGLSFVELKFCSDALAIFEDLGKRFRSTAQARNAGTQAAAVKKILKDKTRCTS